MAEIVILIIFVLLLALAALLADESEKREEAEQELVRYGQMETLFQDEALPEDPVALRSVLRERVDEHDDADSWRELVREIEAAFPEPSVQKVVERIQESEIGRMSPAEAEELLAAHRAVETADAYAELEQAMEAAGLEATPGELREMAEAMNAASRRGMSPAEVREAIEGRDEAEAIGADPAVLSERLDRARERIERLEAQAAARGSGGLDHPSCWYDRDGTVAYLFDVALAAGGFVVAPARAPEHEAARKELPVASVQTSRLLTEAEFLRQTRPVYDWSVARQCRFFVRAFDRVAADKKQIYKRRMQILESRFYKNANPTGGLPAGLRRGGNGHPPSPSPVPPPRSTALPPAAGRRRRRGHGSLRLPRASSGSCSCSGSGSRRCGTSYRCG